jgi:hypothetical protein
VEIGNVLLTLLAFSFFGPFFSEQNGSKKGQCKRHSRKKKEIKERTNRGKRRKTGDTIWSVKVTGRDNNNWGY